MVKSRAGAAPFPLTHGLLSTDPNPSSLPARQFREAKELLVGQKEEREREGPMPTHSPGSGLSYSVPLSHMRSWSTLPTGREKPMSNCTTGTRESPTKSGISSTSLEKPGQDAAPG